MSHSEDVLEAARDAASRAMDQADLDEAGCLIVAASPEHLDEAIDLCEALRDVAGYDAQIVGGATGTALAFDDAGEQEGPALGVLVLEERAQVFQWTPDNPKALRAAAQAAGADALGLVFADPSAPLQRLTAALSREGARIAGGGVAVDGGLLFDDDVSEAMAVGAFFPSHARIAVAQSHQPIGRPLLVTRVEGRSILELDGRPALQALAELSQQPGLPGDALQFIGLGLSPAPGEPFRADDFLSVPLVGVDDESGAIEAGAAVLEGSSVSFTLRDGMGARRTLQDRLSDLPGEKPSWGVYFDCASRGSALYGVEGLDLQLIEKRLGQFPLLAMRTSFELGPSGGKTGLHLFTGVLALGDP